jgi:tetratricopeptide (TPR) repeat protein
MDHLAPTPSTLLPARYTQLFLEANEVFEDRKKAADALKLFQALKDTFETEEMQLTKEYANVLQMIGKCEVRCRKYAEAVASLELCRKCTLKVYGVRSQAYGDILLLVADAQRQNKDFREATKSAEKAQQVLRSVAGENSFQYARTLVVVGSILVDQGNSKKAIEVLEKARKFMKPEHGQEYL